ncbi:MAG: aminoacetone oxidase family FAD-binding enzyme [Oscillospiraceae bacterium]|jgi:predicted Rossmann fold flavoprotein|nr:aminoacetone oxidase family FAD-binding enzyme [Oscillospiraceae bacterium]
MQKIMYDTIIIGGGASGLAAAVSMRRAHPTKRVAVVERLPRVGKKLLATGNGRCNLGNTNALTHPYTNAAFARPALEAFDPKSFFLSIGIAVRSDSEGRLYPLGNQAATVLDALRFSAEREGTKIITDTAIHMAEYSNNRFLLNDSMECETLLLAAGGEAAPQHGTDGGGFSLLRQFGHTITPLKPALVPLTAAGTAPLKGTRIQGNFSLLDSKECLLAESSGEILFTDTGISGIAAMDVSRRAAPGCLFCIDSLPMYSTEESANLLRRFRCDNPTAPWEQLLSGLLPKAYASALCKAAPSAESADFARLCKAFCFSVTGTRGWKDAQVTHGGAHISGWSSHTLRSRLVPNLYAAGEVLDVDGLCGGFNLQWAFASGCLAGQLL